MAPNTDIDLCNLDSEVATLLNLKSHVDMLCGNTEHGIRWCCMLEGNRVGEVPQELCQQVADIGGCPCQPDQCIREGVRVRSLGRDKETQAVVSVKIRLTKTSPGEWVSHVHTAKTVPEAQLQPPVLEDLEKDGIKATHEQLQCLALSLEVRQALKASELQQVVHAVDAAPCREAALAHAMRNPAFAQFCDTVLDAVRPES